MPPNPRYKYGHQDDTNPHELAHGFPHAFDNGIPTGKRGDLSREEKHRHKSYPGEEHRVVQPVGPETCVIFIVIQKDEQQTHYTQSHAANEQPLCLVFKYELRIQIHIADQAKPEIFDLTTMLSVQNSR